MTPRFTIEPSVSINWVDLPEGTFTTRLVSDRTTFTLTPFAFISGLVQYNFGGRSIKFQPPVQVDLPAGQRTVRRLHRRTRYGDARVSRPQEPRVGGKNQSPAAPVIH